jgi:hypothetical protein
MKLLNVLRKTIIENNSASSIIIEIAEKYRQQLLTKFKGETKDSDEEILKIIDSFDRYKPGFPADKRDIMIYLKPENTYSDLKGLIVSKDNLKQIDTIYKELKKKDPKTPNEAKKYIKYFMEIQSELPKTKSDISSYDYLSLVELIDGVYKRLIQKKLMEKFSKSGRITAEQVLYYVSAYLENLDQIPVDTKRVDDMTFSEFEHLIDGLTATTEEPASKGDKYEGIDLIYDQNNLKIFAPLTKDQCIKLKNGRSWCTSREGSGNLYYNYRLNEERTLYYIIDEDKDFKDLDFAVVILVDPKGGMALADGSNSGRYSGHGNIPWNEIENKIPKLKDLKGLLVPKPLTEKEKDVIQKVRSIKVGDNPYESLGDENWVEIWLEYKSPNLSDEQYGYLSIPLKKKYIALGMELTSGQIYSSEPEVLKYYANKKIENIKSKNLGQLNSGDIALLNSPMFKSIKQELKSKFLSQVGGGGKNDTLTISYPSDNAAKYMALYDIKDIFEDLAKQNNLKNIFIENKEKNSSFIISIPSSIARLTNLEGLTFDNCVENIPEEVGSLPNLTYLVLMNNPKLKKIPDSLQNLTNLQFVNLMGSPNVELPDWFTSKYSNFDGSGLWLEEDN